MKEPKTRKSDNSKTRDLQRSRARVYREGFIEDDQYRAILQSLPESLKPIFVVAYHVPLLKQELLALQVDQVDLRNKRLFLNRGVEISEKQDTAPVYGDMFAWLDMQLSRCTATSVNGQHLFIDDHGNPITDLRKPWKRAYQLAGFSNLLFRDLRRTATRKMMQSGFSRQTVVEAAGLKTTSLLWRCTPTDKEDIIAAGRLMQRYFDEQRQLESERPSHIKPN
jgi:integrase